MTVMDNLQQIKKLITETGHEYLQSKMPIELDDFKKEAKPFIKMEKIINKLLKKLKA